MIKKIIEKLKEKDTLNVSLFLLVLFLANAPIFIGCATYYFQERPYYIDAVCQISECTLLDTSLCKKGSTNYNCYSGTYIINPEGMTGIDKEIVYIDRDLFFYQACLNNSTIGCTYYKKDVQNTLSITQQPFFIWFISILAFTGSFIALSLILGPIVISISLFT